MIIRFLVCLLLISVITKAQNYSEKKFRALAWLEGAWKMETTRGPLWEIWKKQNDSTYNIVSFIIKPGGDTLWLEKISFRLRNRIIYYIPAVNDQNNQQPVVFTVTNATATSFTAENPRHDFPKKIIYQKKKKKRMVATISGKLKDKKDPAYSIMPGNKV